MPQLTLQNHTWWRKGQERPIYEPHAGQLEAHRSDARTKVLKWARRGGKGRFCTFEMMEYFTELAQHPRDSSLTPPFWAVVIAPDYKMAAQPWFDLCSFMPPEMIQHMTQDDKKIWLRPQGYMDAPFGKWPNGDTRRIGGLIEVRSADNEKAMQGFGADVVCLHEAQEMSRRILGLVLPTTMSPGRLGKLLVEGIPPEFADHWMNDYFQWGQDREPGFFSSRQTYIDNPMLSEEQRSDIERLRIVYSEDEWERMFMAKDPEESEKAMNIGPCLVGPVKWESQKPKNDHDYDIGVDLGKRVSDTVISVWDKTEIPWKLAYYRRLTTKQDWPVQEAILEEVSERWIQRDGHSGRPTGRIYIDTGGPGDPIYDSLRIKGVPVVPVHLQGGPLYERDRLLNRLAIALEKGQLRIPREESIIRDFNSMRRVRVKGARDTVRWEVREAGSRSRADSVFSIAMGIMDLPIEGAVSMPRKAPVYFGMGVTS